MSNMNTCLISQDNGQLQIPYGEYKALMEKVEEGRRLIETKDAVIANLKNFLGGKQDAAAIAKVVESVKAAEVSAPATAQVVERKEPVLEEVVVEVEPAKPVVEERPPVAEAKQPVATARTLANDLNIPPIKKDISDHLNKLDESGRLFSVFKQYYTCLNDTCGGTVRVTMKDGFCSLWNYDEWEEFAFIDIFEGHLRVSIDPRYTDEMQSLEFCEVPRLLSSRLNLVSVQVDDLSNTMLDLLVKAFKEVGLTTN